MLEVRGWMLEVGGLSEKKMIFSPDCNKKPGIGSAIAEPMRTCNESGCNIIAKKEASASKKN
ncbi:MAG: hypothetical protein H0X46_09080 [Bacteroidetes bacterium]|nr:hypothetical protein [Bacteroidota bacterium]